MFAPAAESTPPFAATRVTSCVTVRAPAGVPARTSVQAPAVPAVPSVPAVPAVPAAKLLGNTLSILRAVPAMRAAPEFPAVPAVPAAVLLGSELSMSRDDVCSSVGTGPRRAAGLGSLALVAVPPSPAQVDNNWDEMGVSWDIIGEGGREKIAEACRAGIADRVGC